ncbi:MAG: FAD-binding oxidoreductase [Steroidobacteraceae bacterium]
MASPPHVSPARLERALGAFAGVVGQEWTFADAATLEPWRDVYQASGQPQHLASAVVAPASTAEVQALVRLANEHRVPLWPVSRGKNFGYGAAAPRVNGAVVVDLGRMNRILDVDVARACCVLEPGVGFYDLYAFLQKEKLPLWMSIPGNAWGSVIGNALERGMGMSPYGDHCERLCGMEVVLPDGELLRTGNGAMANGALWHLAHHGFGPSWDPMFMQSSLGIVCKAGMWLMPEPEATAQAMLHLENVEDLAWAVDVLGALRLQRVIEHVVVVFNYLEQAFLVSQRADWYQGAGPMPDDVIAQVIAKLGIGYWSIPIRLYGYEETVDANARVIRKALAPHLAQPVEFQRWRRGEPIEQSAANIPSVLSLQAINWYGGRGGHIGFSPLLPLDGRRALEQFLANKARYAEAGLDYNTTFGIAERFLVNINMLLYDRDNAAQCERVTRLFGTLVEDSRRRGYPEYRTHLDFMDVVAGTFDYGDHALRRLNERVKDALDPNGILAPGKQGVWPRAWREQRGR